MLKEPSSPSIRHCTFVAGFLKQFWHFTCVRLSVNSAYRCIGELLAGQSGGDYRRLPNFCLEGLIPIGPVRAFEVKEGEHTSRRLSGLLRTHVVMVCPDGVEIAFRVALIKRSSSAAFRAFQRSAQLPCRQFLSNTLPPWCPSQCPQPRPCWHPWPHGP